MAGKTESLRWRISPELKQDLIEAAKKADISASEYARSMVRFAVHGPSSWERTPLGSRVVTHRDLTKKFMFQGYEERKARSMALTKIIELRNKEGHPFCWRGF